MADVVDNDLGLDKIIVDLVKLAKSEILIGVQANSKTTVSYVGGRKSEGGKNIAEYASENEFGTNKIPERSFLRSSFDENLNIVEPFIVRQYQQIIDGNITMQQGLGLIGRTMEQNVKLKIRQIRTPPNSPRTIAIKKSSKPLIDFGALFDSIRYIIKIKK